MTHVLLVCGALMKLSFHDLFMWRHDFSSLHRTIKAIPVSDRTASQTDIDAVCHAVDAACVFYPHQALCLQRSAVLVRLLRARGVHAVMLIGARKLPFKAHAWVEVEGRVVGDRTVSRGEFS